MTALLLILLLGVFLSATMAAAWLVAIWTGKSGWVDAIWSFAVGAGGFAVALMPFEGSGSWAVRQSMVACLAAVWSLRLGLHIVARTAGGGDDPRYAQLREEWGQNFKQRLFWFLQVQAAAAFLLVMSIFAAARNPAQNLGIGDWLGIAVLIVAIGGEALADRQLTAFRSSRANKGRVCDEGLWGMTRHPNYFFEWLGWVAYPLIAIDLTSAYPWGWAALAGPLFMYWLLVHVSGIPPLEAHMLRSRGEKFREYQQRVNAFWPGPQQRPAGSKTEGTQA